MIEYRTPATEQSTGLSPQKSCPTGSHQPFTMRSGSDRGSCPFRTRQAGSGSEPPAGAPGAWRGPAAAASPPQVGRPRLTGIQARQQAPNCPAARGWALWAETGSFLFCPLHPKLSEKQTQPRFPNWASRRLAGRFTPEPRCTPGVHVCRWGTCMCACTWALLARCCAHAGEETGTRVEGWSRGCARPHSHLLQKQKWQPYRHDCDSSPGETAPAGAAKALAPTGPRWQSALPTPLPRLRHCHWWGSGGGCLTPSAQGSRTSQDPGTYEGGKGPRVMKRRPRRPWGSPEVVSLLYKCYLTSRHARPRSEVLGLRNFRVSHWEPLPSCPYGRSSEGGQLPGI